MTATSLSPSLPQILKSEKQMGCARETKAWSRTRTKGPGSRKQLCQEELQKCFLTTVGRRAGGSPGEGDD